MVEEERANLVDLLGFEVIPGEPNPHIRWSNGGERPALIPELRMWFLLTGEGTLDIHVNDNGGLVSKSTMKDGDG